jgi:hypothetical protein
MGSVTSENELDGIPPSIGDEQAMGNESDEDESTALDKEVGLDEKGQASLDTAPLDVTNCAGEIIHKGQLCGVIMSAKTPEGERLFCGYLSEVCRRPKHQQKRLDPALCVTPSVYSGVLNSTKKVIDGIVSSWISLEERKRQAAANYQDLAEAVITSAQKRQSEDRAAQKTPSVISSSWMRSLLPQSQFPRRAKP